MNWTGEGEVVHTGYWCADYEEAKKTDPLINRESVLQLFQEMRREKEGAELEVLEFVVGDWDMKDFVSMAGFRGLPRVAYWKCFLDGGEERCEGRQERMAQ
jgi:hypothetical protein